MAVALANQTIARPGILEVVFSPKWHNWIISVQLPTLMDKRATVQYLKGLHWDLSTLEAIFKRSIDSIQSMHHLFRSEAILKDIRAMQVEDVSKSKLVETYKHREYFFRMQDQTHRLIAHLAIHYFGLLSGGQMFKKKLSYLYGPDTVHLYSFENPTKAFQSLKQELQEYIESLREEQFVEFQKEVETAWYFSADLFGNDMRRPPLSRL